MNKVKTGSDQKLLLQREKIGYGQILTALTGFLLWQAAEHGSFDEKISTVVYALSFVVSGFYVISDAFDALTGLRVPTSCQAVTFGGMIMFLAGKRSEAALVMLMISAVKTTVSLLVNVKKKGLSSLLGGESLAYDWKVGGKIIRIDVDRIDSQMVLCLNPGDWVPVDSVVSEGGTTLENLVQGKRVRREVSVGNQIAAGERVVGRPLTVETVTGYSDSPEKRMKKALRDFTVSGSRMAMQFRRTEMICLLAMMAVSAITAAVLVSSGNTDGLQVAAMGGMMMICASAGVLPYLLEAFGIRTAELLERQQVMMKSLTSLEKSCDMDSLVMELEGNLEDSHLETERIETEMDPDEFLKIAASVLKDEKGPQAQAIRKSYQNISELQPVCQVTCDQKTHGISALLGSTRYYLGSGEYMKYVGIQPDDDTNGTYLAADGKILGRIIFRSSIITERQNQLRTLKTDGISSITVFSTKPDSYLDEYREVFKGTEILGGELPSARRKTISALKKGGHRVLYLGKVNGEYAESADCKLSFDPDGRLESCDGICLNGLESYCNTRNGFMKISKAATVSLITAVVIRVVLLALIPGNIVSPVACGAIIAAGDLLLVSAALLWRQR